MKIKEIAQLSKEELIAKLAEEKTQLQRLKFAHAVSSIENPMKINATRKTIARMQTVLTNLVSQGN